MTAPDMLAPPAEGDDWLGLSAAPLPVDRASSWAVRDDCGGIVSFVGAARDHSAGRAGVDLLEYEAYESQVVPLLARIAHEIRSRWPDVGRIALLHRIGALTVGDAAVVVVVSSPHRDAAFEAARFAIDTLKSTVPIWKKERWRDGSSWGLEAQHLEDIPDIGNGSTAHVDSGSGA